MCRVQKCKNIQPPNIFGKNFLIGIFQSVRDTLQLKVFLYHPVGGKTALHWTDLSKLVSFKNFWFKLPGFCIKCMMSCFLGKII